MKRFVVAAVVLATALDVATFYLLPARGAWEANALAADGGAAVVVVKIALGAAVALAVARGKWPRFYLPTAVLLVAWWGFGAWVNVQ